MQDLVWKKKASKSADRLCCGVPTDFSTFLNLTRSQQFDEQPDYADLCHLLREIFISRGYQHDFIFDWCIPTEKSALSATGNMATQNGKCASLVVGWLVA
ncbi:hypothetical protein SCP_1102270 [Sparassis crispa]|uniref:Non-specific serine/threonine protein kinase n=1 Tax=Sparassis crispa TaxID=139825 RepID=A0A401GZH7_9APHY|nr:hypothetical protein SCP_1102270 [Sparassis crispa]GBE87550.1 hypothetical protein SCP_1102270 [Sparassis crispa]